MEHRSTVHRMLGAIALALALAFATSGCGNVGFYFSISTIADADAPRDAQVGATVTLDGSGSSSGWNLIISYQWSFVSRPSGSTATIRPALFGTAIFVPDVPGPYQVLLRVTDQAGNSSTTTVEITATGG